MDRQTMAAYDDSDDGRFDAIERVFAVSGAAMMIRCAVLPILAVDGEIFDEDFFIYHEDTDLAWRARNCGYSSLYVPGARATHVRGWKHGQAQRFQIASNIRRHSFKVAASSCDMRTQADTTRLALSFMAIK